MGRSPRWPALPSIRQASGSAPRCPLTFTSGDWPPKGVRVRSVVALFRDGCSVEALAPGEAPVDALARAVGEHPYPDPWPVGVVSQPPDESGCAAAWLAFGSPSVELPVGLDLPGLDAASAAELLAEARRIVADGARGPIFTEVRHHVFTEPSFFHCRLVERGEGLAILEYTSRREGAVKSVTVPRGSRTLARYAEGEPFVSWRIESPTGAHLCSVIHLAEGVRIGGDRVCYRDLLLDVFIVPGARPELIDQDDLEQAVTDRFLSRDRAGELLRLADKLAADPSCALTGL